MSFNGSEGEAVSLEEASRWTARWREEKQPEDSNGMFFGREKLEDILGQQGCMGIRMYYAIDDDGQKTLVLVGAEESEDDQTNGMILDRAINCPPRCGNGNGLNGGNG